jgi:hypothetical protein
MLNRPRLPPPSPSSSSPEDAGFAAGGGVESPSDGINPDAPGKDAGKFGLAEQAHLVKNQGAGMVPDNLHAVGESEDEHSMEKLLREAKGDPDFSGSESSGGPEISRPEPLYECLPGELKTEKSTIKSEEILSSPPNGIGGPKVHSINELSMQLRQAKFDDPTAIDVKASSKGKPVDLEDWRSTECETQVKLPAAPGVPASNAYLEKSLIYIKAKRLRVIIMLTPPDFDKLVLDQKDVGSRNLPDGTQPEGSQRDRYNCVQRRAYEVFRFAGISVESDDVTLQLCVDRRHARDRPARNDIYSLTAKKKSGSEPTVSVNDGIPRYRASGDANTREGNLGKGKSGENQKEIGRGGNFTENGKSTKPKALFAHKGENRAESTAASDSSVSPDLPPRRFDTRMDEKKEDHTSDVLSREALPQPQLASLLPSGFLRARRPSEQGLAEKGNKTTIALDANRARKKEARAISWGDSGDLSHGDRVIRQLDRELSASLGAQPKDNGSWTAPWLKTRAPRESEAGTPAEIQDTGVQYRLRPGRATQNRREGNQQPSITAELEKKFRSIETNRLSIGGVQIERSRLQKTREEWEATDASAPDVRRSIIESTFREARKN